MLLEVWSPSQVVWDGYLEITWGRLRLVRPHFYEVKILKAMTRCFGLESISSLNLSNVQVESDCVKVVKLLNGE